MAASIPSTKTIADAVLRLQHILLDHGAPSERHLIATAALLSRPDYSDVVTERNISSICGFPLCLNPLSPSSHKSRARYRISLSEHRVYDLDEINKFCSEKCLVASKAYEASLGEKRSIDLSRDKIDGVLKLFEEGNEELGLGFEKDGDLGMKEVRIVEKEGGTNVETTIDEWVGSAQAIEGYEPKFDRHKGSKYGIAHNQETDFASEIIFYDGPSSFETKDISGEISRKLENIVLAKKNNNINKNKNKETSKSSAKPVKAEKKGEKTDLKSSLKKNDVSSASRNKWSVKWADNEENNSIKSKSDMLSEEEMAEKSLRLASAEACVDALIHASEAASSGNSAIDEAVSEAGIVILPQPKYENEKISDENKEDSFESDREIVKWPKKPVLLETNDFQADDSWHDTPPDGFSLTLSPFATIWTSIFEWMTCSSIAFIYGNGEDQAENFLEVNGQEYPRKIVLLDGHSAEIRKALDFFLCHALPALVSDLRLPVPVSTLEKNLALLIDTMSFLEALPSLRMQQWRVIVLLFLGALSVHHLPSLAPIMANRTALSHKVLNAAQITGEEYDSMINLVLPLGKSSVSLQQCDST